ncbi:Slp family lipoprotein [Marinobacterium weihaiense]|uniref:Slp family lipoprotein n=1 Tax=Marinobacterium weihaiense TaxID=2851016 RepID=A0ABS6MBD6_9GAMM|nr:Slp family lipoprotein [Marinobacterium weihaiense]MBV0933609.1 Slp family lipoprotein [Marinobacterium weihaiense]
MLKQLALLTLTLALGACAAVPEGLKTEDTRTLLPFAEHGPDAAPATARWGGEIAAVHNRAESTEIEVVQFELNASGRPLKSDTSGGRFRLQVPGFLDPAIHAPGRLVTALGTFSGMTDGHIDEQPYRFPVLRSESVHLWPVIKEPVKCDCEPMFNSPLLMRPIIVVPQP